MTFTVGIAGITGKFARSITRNLLEKPNVKIRGYCRDPSKLSQTLRSSPQIHITKGESDDKAALRTFVKGTDVVLCAYLGSDQLMVDGQKALIDACDDEGVPRYIASDYSLDFRKLEYGQLESKDAMKTVQAYLETKKSTRGVHVLIGVFMDTFFSRFFQVWDEENMQLKYWGTGDEKWESTSYDNAAEFVAEIALDKDAVGFHEFLGDRKSVHEIADRYEKVYGKQVNLKQQGSQEELYALMHKLRTETPADFGSYVPLLYQYYCTNGQTYLKDELDNDKYPHIEPTTFEKYLRLHKLEELSDANRHVGSQI